MSRRLARAPARSRLELAAGVLLRGLPAGAVRTLGRRLGDLARLVQLRRRRRVLEALARLRPDLDPAARRRLARAWFRRRGEVACERLAGRDADLVEFCRRLTLAGWERLLEAAGRGAARRGVLLVTARLDRWEVALRALATYSGPLHVVDPLQLAGPAHSHQAAGPEAATAPSPRLPPDWAGGMHGGAPPATGGPTVEDLARALAGGELVVVPLDAPAAAGVADGGGFEVNEERARAAAQLALRAGTPALPIFVVSEPRGSYRVELRPPLAPASEAAGGGDEAVAAFAARLFAVVDAEVRARPEAWETLDRAAPPATAS